MSTNKTVLALCAHPDDAEIRCSGTLFLLKAAGWDVHICTVSTGDCGSAELTPNEIAIIRRQEAKAAAAYLGAEYHCLGGQDLRIFDDDYFRSKTVELIRIVRPDVVITHFPVDYMPDHTITSELARMATFTASIRNYVTGPAAAVPPVSSIPALYYFGPLGGVDWLGNPIEPQFLVDVTTEIDKKAEMLACHASQRDWLRIQHGMDQYIEEMKRADAEAGAPVGMTYAEGFCMHKGHGYPQAPIIENALAGLVKQSPKK